MKKKDIGEVLTGHEKKELKVGDYAIGRSSYDIYKIEKINGEMWGVKLKDGNKMLVKILSTCHILNNEIESEEL